LFCPADRPERYAKAAAVADVVILDLEDGVAPQHKQAAREALLHTEIDPARTIVRINPAGTADQSRDLAALGRTGYTTVMLAKTEAPEQITALTGFAVIALAETPRGVLAAERIAAAEGTAGLMWGAEDLIAGLGGGSSRHPDGQYRDVARHARSMVLLAAKAYGRVALDAVHLDIADLGGLRQEAQDAAACGFTATVCIHPSQLETVREAYRPAPHDQEWAQRVLSAAQHERGVFRFEGRMVDAPVLQHAQAILRQAGGG
jgi:citrate lyase subunit beta/citryl-CoA lyase